MFSGLDTIFQSQATQILPVSYKTHNFNPITENRQAYTPRKTAVKTKGVDVDTSLSYLWNSKTFPQFRSVTNLFFSICILG